MGSIFPSCFSHSRWLLRIKGILWPCIHKGGKLFCSAKISSTQCKNYYMLELCEAKIIWSCKAPMVFLFLGLQCSSPLSWLLLFIAMTKPKQGFTFHIHLHFLDHSILSISRVRISFSISMHPIPPCLNLILIDKYKFLSVATRELRPKKETLLSDSDLLHNLCF